MSEPVTLPTLNALEFFDEQGKVLFKADILTLNAMLTLAQSGLDRNQTDFIEAYATRLAYDISVRFREQLAERSVSPAQAYFVGEAAASRLRAAQANFLNGSR